MRNVNLDLKETIGGGKLAAYKRLKSVKSGDTIAILFAPGMLPHDTYSIMIFHSRLLQK